MSLSDGPPWRQVPLSQITVIELMAIKELVIAFLIFQNIS